MKTYIPKQPKHNKERIEVKLETRLVSQLERYCQYLESDRDYVLSKVLELIFRKDKGFAEWLASNGDKESSQALEVRPEESTRRGVDLRPEKIRIGGTQ